MITSSPLIDMLQSAGLPEIWEHWDEDKTPHRPLLRLYGRTYRVDRLFDLRPMERTLMTTEFVVSPQGTRRLRK